MEFSEKEKIIQNIMDIKNEIISMLMKLEMMELNEELMDLIISETLNEMIEMENDLSNPKMMEQLRNKILFDYIKQITENKKIESEELDEHLENIRRMQNKMERMNLTQELDESDDMSSIFDTDLSELSSVSDDLYELSSDEEEREFNVFPPLRK